MSSPARLLTAIAPPTAEAYLTVPQLKLLQLYIDKAADGSR